MENNTVILDLHDYNELLIKAKYYDDYRENKNKEEKPKTTNWNVDNKDKTISVGNLFDSVFDSDGLYTYHSKRDNKMKSVVVRSY